jgi:carbon storage regulator
MLILTRKEGETIVIGDSIRVTLKSIRGRTARIMISAPSGMPIYREEVYKSIEEENLAAARPRQELPRSVGSVVVSLDDASNKEK